MTRSEFYAQGQQVSESGPMMTGKSTLAAALIAAYLRVGKTVMVATLAGSTLRRQHRSGLIVITPIRRQHQHAVIIDDEL